MTLVDSMQILVENIVRELLSERKHKKAAVIEEIEDCFRNIVDIYGKDIKSFEEKDKDVFDIKRACMKLIDEEEFYKIYDYIAEQESYSISIELISPYEIYDSKKWLNDKEVWDGLGIFLKYATKITKKHENKEIRFKYQVTCYGDKELKDFISLIDHTAKELLISDILVDYQGGYDEPIKRKYMNN